MSEAAFERILVGARDGKIELSTASILRLAKRFHCGPAESPAVPAIPDFCTVADLEVLRAQGRRFGTIYADPPWRFQNTASRGAAANHYPTMSLDEIKALPIRDLAAEGAHCHCWVPNAFLFHAPAILAAWGFEQKSLFIWVKPHFGAGNYFRLAHEFLVTGLRPDGAFRDHSQRS